MPEKVYQHTALFFEKNFHRDRMPTYKDHTVTHLADCTSPTSSQSTSLTSQPKSPTQELCPFSQTPPLLFPPNFAFLFPSLQSANYSTEKTQCRKRRMASYNRTNSPAPSKLHTASPSQSRRFYNCLGCGAAKRWDRLTDHYRKVNQILLLNYLLWCWHITFAVCDVWSIRTASAPQPGHYDPRAVCAHHDLQGAGIHQRQDAPVQGPHRGQPGRDLRGLKLKSRSEFRETLDIYSICPVTAKYGDVLGKQTLCRLQNSVQR